MFFKLYFRKIIWPNHLKLNTTLSFSQSFKNYPSLERSAKISALIPPFQIFFTHQLIYLSIIPRNLIITSITNKKFHFKKEQKGWFNNRSRAILR
ncbi:MAG: hypothetical protein BGO31_09910 [Bacteroidetes bacterium 43-16]|nr:MAG: hypothetical protein BGO31_09910 [Bacteroidetes bacterium 43-16]